MSTNDSISNDQDGVFENGGVDDRSLSLRIDDDSMEFVLDNQDVIKIVGEPSEGFVAAAFALVEDDVHDDNIKLPVGIIDIMNSAASDHYDH